MSKTIIKSLVFVLFIFISFSLVSAAELSLSNIEDQYAGNTLYLGGTAPSGELIIKIYQPEQDDPWKTATVKTRPDHMFSYSVRLPEKVIGTYKVVVESDYGEVSQDFEVIENENKNNEEETTFERDTSESISSNKEIEKFSDEGIKVIYNGNNLKLDQKPLIKNEEPMIPIINIFELLGVKTNWDNENNIFTAIKGINSIELTINSNQAVINGEKVNLSDSVIKSNDNLFVPVTILNKFLSYVSVNWNKSDKTIIIGSKEGDEWWYKYPTMAESNYSRKTDARSARSNYGADFGWGLYTQRLSYEQTKNDIRTQKFLDKKVVSYIEATGQPRTYSVGYKRNSDGSFPSMFSDPDAPKPLFNAWSWKDSNVKRADYITYTGIHSTVNNEAITQPGYTMEALNHPMPKYPDGDDAVGYFDNELPDPVNAKAYDVIGTKDLNGKLSLDFGMPYDGDNTDGLIGVEVGSYYLPSYRNKKDGEKVFFRDIKFFTETANPFWEDYHRISAAKMMEFELDGAWCDNMSLWDNFRNVNNMFGEWSEYRFNQFLEDNFSESELSDIGIENMAQFNIREYIKEKAEEYGESNPDNLSSGIYKKDIWIEDPVWSLYKIFKKDMGRQTLQDFYRVIKDEAKKAGREDGFAVIGNDMPKLNHGWIEDGWLDMAGTELHSGWSTTFGSRGLKLPPVGKMAVMYRTLLEQQSGPYPVVWFYSDGEEGDNTELGKVLLAEAFANHTFIKRNHNTVGNNESHKWLNDFVHSQEEKLSPRYPHYDIGILFSSQNQLGKSVPGNAMVGTDMDEQYHVQGHWGFAHALIDAHISYKVITDWKLNSQTLKGLKTLIMPNPEFLDDEVLPILENFVKNGGRLVITGPAGTRHGFNGYFQSREQGLLDEFIGRKTTEAPGVRLSQNPNAFDRETYTNQLGEGTVVWTAQPLGYSYFDNLFARSSLLPKIVNMVEGNNIFNGSNLKSTIGSFLWKSKDGKDLFVDLVNYNIGVMDYKIQPATDIKFEIKLPEGAKDCSVIAISPAGNQELEANIDNGWVSITLPELKYYTSVKIMTE